MSRLETHVLKCKFSRKLKVFVTNGGFQEKNSLFSIKTIFTLLEKLKSKDLGKNGDPVTPEHPQIIPDRTKSTQKLYLRHIFFSGLRQTISLHFPYVAVGRFCTE